MPKLKFEKASFAGCGFEKASFASPEPSPLDAAEYTDDPEADSSTELEIIENSFAERAARENERRSKAIDSEYWLCLCFQTREQAEAFTAAAGWGRRDEKYIDGRKAAKVLGIDLPPDGPPFGRPKIDRKLADLS